MWSMETTNAARRRVELLPTKIDTVGFLDACRSPYLAQWSHRGQEREKPMTSESIRNPLTDALLTPTNSALVVIDYQPAQIATVTSMDTKLLTRNIVSVARLAKAYGLPIVLSTVNVVANGQPPTLSELREVLSDSVELDRTQINAWEDV